MTAEGTGEPPQNLIIGKMNPSRLIPIFLLATLGCGAGLTSLKGQSPFDPAYEETARKIREQVNVFTDRSIYAVGETLKFRADHSVSQDLPGRWSTVFYVELVTSAGNAVAQAKFPLSQGLSTGSLLIPSGILTGNYYLKCYTRWMRNSGPGTFSYLPLKIINPNRIEVVNGSNGKGYQTNLTSRAYRQGEISCSSDASVYSRGAEVSIQVEGPYNAYLESISCCLTVVPAGAIDTLSGQLRFSSDRTSRDEYAISYLPDLGFGPSLSGSVVQADDSPATFTSLHFSILGKEPCFFSALTDGLGRFAVSIPKGIGTQELYVSPDSKDETLLEVRIDQDFDASSFQLPSIKFSLSEWEREVATRMSLAMQFSRVYGSPVPPAIDTTEHTSHAFYGSRIHRLNMDDYVNLPTLEEVFINLVPNVDVAGRKGKKALRIRSENSGIGVYPPLIMIDNISVFDQEAVLDLPPEKIDRIDLINEVYLKGSMAFGGLLAIYSKEGDLAGIDLPPGSYFFDFQSFSPEPKEYMASPSPGDRIPDLRNTILWKDNLHLSKTNPAELSFIAPTAPGKYVILVRARAPDGELWSASSMFEVE